MHARVRLSLGRRLREMKHHVMFVVNPENSLRAITMIVAIHSLFSEMHVVLVAMLSRTITLRLRHENRKDLPKE